MKRGALIATAALALAAFACERKHEDKASETSTTSATVDDNRGGGTVDNTTVEAPRAIEQGPIERPIEQGTSDTSSSKAKGDLSGSLVNPPSDVSKKDGGVSGSVGVGVDSDKAKDVTGSSTSDSTAAPTTTTKSKDNKSTTLGDGTSGQYTGGKGSYGGKSTHGTGEKK